MSSFARRLVIPLASTLVAAVATLAACLPEETEEAYPVVPSGGSPVSGTVEGTGFGGGGDGPDAGVDVGDGGFGDGGTGLFDAGGGFLDVGTVPLDAFGGSVDDAGTTLIPSDAAGSPSFPEGDQIP